MSFGGIMLYVVAHHTLASTCGLTREGVVMHACGEGRSVLVAFVAALALWPILLGCGGGGGGSGEEQSSSEYWSAYRRPGRANTLAPKARQTSTPEQSRSRAISSV